MYLPSFCRILFFILLVCSMMVGCQPASGDQGDSAGAGKGTAQEWKVLLNDAYDLSVKEQKPILAYFASSDTCALCKQLEQDVLSSPLFTTWSEKNVVLYKVDAYAQRQLSPEDQEQNAAMASYLKVSTYPTFWMLNITHEADNGRFKVKPLGYTGYQSSPEKLIGALQNFMRR